MTSIGIVGAGVSALHLGLLLRQHDVPVTIYAEKSAADVASVGASRMRTQPETTSYFSSAAMAGRP